MARRPGYQRRPGDIKRGSLALWPADKPSPESVAERVRYVANGLHKRHPGPWTIANRANESKCDVYAETDWPKIQEALQAAIRSGFADEDFRGDFPARVWIYIDDVLHEARLSSQSRGEYHGFPVNYPKESPQDPHGLLKRIPHVAIHKR